MPRHTDGSEDRPDLWPERWMYEMPSELDALIDGMRTHIQGSSIRFSFSLTLSRRAPNRQRYKRRDLNPREAVAPDSFPTVVGRIYEKRSAIRLFELAQIQSRTNPSARVRGVVAYLMGWQETWIGSVSEISIAEF